MNVSETQLLQENITLRFDRDIETMADISPHPVFIHRAGLILYANSLMASLLKVAEPSLLIGRQISSFLAPEEVSHFQAVVATHATQPVGDVLTFNIIDREGANKTIYGRAMTVIYQGEESRVAHVYNYDEVEQVVKRNEEKDIILNKLVEVLPDSIVVVNSVTRQKLYSNRSLIDRLGYTPADFAGGDEFDLINKIIHPDDRARLLEARAFINDPNHSSRFATTEYRVLNKGGEWVWVQGRSCSLMSSPDGVGLINFGIVQDISLLKEKEKALIEYQAFQEKINTNSPVLVTVFDLSKNTSVYRSKNMAEWFKYKEEDFPALTADLIHPEYRQEREGILEKVKAIEDGGVVTSVLPHVLGDGSIRFLFSRATPFQRDKQGAVTHILIAHSDITDLKEIEYKLDKSEETRKAILYAMPDMVFIVNTEYVITDLYATDAHRDVIESMNLKGKTILEFTNEATHAQVAPLIISTIAEQKIQKLEFKQSERDRDYYYELRISPYTDTEVIIIARDISEERQAQFKIDQYNNELYAKNQELERYITSNSELEKFAYIASHDLREPLRSLTGFAQLLQKRNEGTLSKESEEFIENIIQGSQRMNTLVNGLLDYSRITSTSKPFTTVNLKDLLKKVISDLKATIEETNTEIISFDMPEIYCDELQVRQLFQNLISNSIKFRSEVKPIIKIFSEKIENYWQFKVEDNGIGIDMRYKEQVFQIFTRLHSQDKYQGSGIGLSVCKKILERHGGRIWLESTLGKGTTIYFTIIV